MANKCKECGCPCSKCSSNYHDIQMHLEIENLKQKLLEKENHIVMMETNFLNETNKFPGGEIGALKEELLTWQDKYKRLYEAHRRVQRVNQGLEDKLLKLVDVCETDKNILTRDVATLSHSLAEANYAIKKLTDDNERYKNDVSLAIQFLQCKQTNFVAHRFDSLPLEVQTQVAAFMNDKRKPAEEKSRIPLEPKSIKVPIPTFPPTAMVYSVPKSPNQFRKPLNEEDLDHPQVDIVSAAIMAKVLEERQKDRALAKHCDTCTCAKNLKILYEITHHYVGTQTGNEYKENVCLKCNEMLNNNTGIQVLKSVDEKPKKSLTYPIVTTSLPIEITQNIVKVQPNNFLIENNTTSEFSNQSIKPTTIIDIRPTKDLIDFDEINLRNKEQLRFELMNKNVDVPVNPKEQGGSKNILLDNAHNVVYAQKNDNDTDKNKHPVSQIFKPPIIHQDSSVSTQGSKHISIISENSVQHQQRINDWVQVTVENDNISSPENSRMEELKLEPGKELQIKLDKARYAEMEENVKRFLFGESDFWKTVEIGKLKYKSFQKIDDNNVNNNHKAKKLLLNDSNYYKAESRRSSHHTETEI